jgi:hypothetical protein
MINRLLLPPLARRHEAAQRRGYSVARSFQVSTWRRQLPSSRFQTTT